MLPLLELPTDCLLTIDNGKLRSGQKGVLNPFAYSTVNGVLTASARWADSREWKIPLIGKSQEEKDFHAFVLVAETPEGRLEVIRTDEAGKKMDKVVVVPGRGQEPIWICPDGWHLSLIERDGDRVRATPVLLSAPFQDLVSWFRDLNGKIRRARALEWVRSAVTGTGAWAPELWEDPGDDRVYAHAQFREETAWAKGSLDLGIASLHGVAAMAIPPAGEFAKAVLSKYLTVKAGCFESLETALSRVKADTGDTTHVAGMLMKRAFVVRAHWRTRPVGDELHLHVVLGDPVKATQVLVREVPLADNAMNYLQLLPESAITDTHRKEELVVLTASLGVEERKRAIGRREAFYKPPSKEELVATLAANRDQLVVPEEKRRKYASLAEFFHKRHAPEVDEEVVLFLLVGMVEAASPFDGWFTRSSESIMHSLHLNEEAFEAAIGVVMGAKAGFFLFEGFEEAFEEGFSVTSLVSGLSYAFTWVHLTPEGGLETLFGTFGSNLPWFAAIAPFYGALKFAETMLDHVKHAVDTIQELRMAAEAAKVEETITSPERFAEVLLRAMDTMVVPGHKTLDFDARPLGLPGGDTPLVAYTPPNNGVNDVRSIRFAGTGPKIGRLTVNDDQFLVAFASGVEAAEKVWGGGCAYDAAVLEILDGRLRMVDRPGCSLDEEIRLFLPLDGPLTKKARIKHVVRFVGSCEAISGVARASRLGVALQVALVALVARAADLVGCPSTEAERVVECLLRGEDGLPVFEAGVFSGGLSDVDRVFC